MSCTNEEIFNKNKKGTESILQEDCFEYAHRTAYLPRATLAMSARMIQINLQEFRSSDMRLACFCGLSAGSGFWTTEGLGIEV